MTVTYFLICLLVWPYNFNNQSFIEAIQSVINNLDELSKENKEMHEKFKIAINHIIKIIRASQNNARCIMKHSRETR